MFCQVTWVITGEIALAKTRRVYEICLPLPADVERRTRKEDVIEESKGQAQRSRKKRNTIRVYPKMWAPIAGKVGASAAEK